MARTKGAEGKTNAGAKALFRAILDRKSHHVENWLDQAAEQDPARALDLLLKLAEYVMPKLARTEHTGDENNPVKVDVTLKLPPEEAYKRLLSE